MPSSCFANPARELFFSGAAWPKRMQAETAAGNAIDEDGITHRSRIKERKPL